MSAVVRTPVMTADEWRRACLATAPPLTASQKATLRALLNPPQAQKTAPRPPRRRAAPTSTSTQGGTTR